MPPRLSLLFTMALLMLIDIGIVDVIMVIYSANDDVVDDAIYITIIVFVN